MTVWTAAAVFAVAAIVVIVVAPRMVRVSDALVSRTRFGAALFGAVFLGASTSLPGIVVTVSAALRGHADLAAANALGGIVAQTMFLALADAAYGRGALQRLTVSAKSVAQFALVTGLLALVVVGLGAPTVTLGTHVTTPLLLVGYLAGMLAIRAIPDDVEEGDGIPEASTADVPLGDADRESDEPEDVSLSRLWVRYGVLAALLGGSGVALSLSVEPIAAAAGLQLAAAGALLTATATSSPELLTAIAAARRGALRLAVGDIAGGNAFDVLFLAAADIAVFGTLYPQLGPVHVLLAGVALILNAVLLLGFIRRGRGVGGARVAPESVVVLGGYAVVAVVLLTG